MNRLLIFALLALPAMAQTVPYAYLATTGNVSLNSATTAATLQQPATGSLPVSFPVATDGASPPVGASVFCSAACVATLSRTCTTAASATAGTVNGINATTPPSVVTFWTASNASGCTTLRVINIAAGQEYPLDMSSMLMGSGTNAITNITISIASVTGTVNITFFPLEKH